MCLSNPTTKEPIIAEDDIICFKVLRKTENGLESPYYHFLYEFDNVYDEPSFGGTSFRRNNMIEYGFHSFITYDDAVKEKNDWSIPSDHVLVKCVIPKGSPFFMGDFEMFEEPVKVYCSRNIQIISIIVL